MRLEHRLAIRNLLRNRHRTLLTALMIISVVSLMILFQGLSGGGHRAMIDVGIQMGLGHVLVYQQGYTDDPSLDHLMSDSAVSAAYLQTALPQVHSVVRRLRLNGLIQAGANGMPITLSGVEADKEVQVSSIADRKAIVAGNTLADLPAQRAAHE
ncbi:MAG: ABC transporter permease, partial [Gammaproteobacteria bacterium]